jgi:type VI secretion system protein ImpJ
MPASELVDVVPLRFKVGAPDDVDKFVLSAMPGVRLQHAPQVPAAVPVRPDALYFSIEAKGQMYERMLQAQSISIYVPAAYRPATGTGRRHILRCRIMNTVTAPS